MKVPEPAVGERKRERGSGREREWENKFDPLSPQKKLKRPRGKYVFFAIFLSLSGKFPNRRRWDDIIWHKYNHGSKWRPCLPAEYISYATHGSLSTSCFRLPAFNMLRDSVRNDSCFQSNCELLVEGHPLSPPTT